VGRAPAPSLQPNLAEVYRAKIAFLQGEVAKSDGSNTAELEALRDLIERVALEPKDANDEPVIISPIRSNRLRNVVVLPWLLAMIGTRGSLTMPDSMASIRLKSHTVQPSGHLPRVRRA
jgi:hypothetical protein